MKNMGEYHDNYLKRDILLIADVFEKFITTCLKYYGLDPCHYFRSPGLRWEAVLNMNETELELISANDTYDFIEKAMRRGISCITKRYSKANNKYMEDYDANKPTKFIMYLDANNLYHWGMSQYLPYGGLKWLRQKKNDKFDESTVAENSSDGYIFEVDLEYPDELPVFHNDYPLAPEKREISNDMLSNY